MRYNSPMLRIAQISDLHIAATDAAHYNLDVRAHLRAVVTAILAQQPDVLVVSGDLAAIAGEPEAYVWLDEIFQEFTCPVHIMMGNHDRLAAFNSAFKLDNNIQNQQLYYRIDYPETTLLFLDSAPANLSGEQLDWLQAQDQMLEDALLFVHHPPLLCGSVFMDDKHKLKNHEESWEVIRKLKHIQHIFSGHYHTERTLCVDNKSLHLTPSTMLQIDTKHPTFKQQHAFPGWRWIEYDGQRLQTWCDYIFEDLTT